MRPSWFSGLGGAPQRYLMSISGGRMSRHVGLLVGVRGHVALHFWGDLRRFGNLVGEFVSARL